MFALVLCILRASVIALVAGALEMADCFPATAEEKVAHLAISRDWGRGPGRGWMVALAHRLVCEIRPRLGCPIVLLLPLRLPQCPLPRLRFSVIQHLRPAREQGVHTHE